ncbi:SufD family Fe-S cluster assembly protein [Patescibacteria group bacterium]
MIVKRINKSKSIIQDSFKNNEVYRFDVENGVDVTIVCLLQQSIVTTIDVRLNDNGSHANIIGIVLGDKKDNISLHTIQHHRKKDTTSRLLIKSVLKDESKFSFQGDIKVDKNAQKIDAYQRNENLLLSKDAHVQSKPALEILADDVRCTHGATIFSIHSEQMLYLQSRGITKEVAQKLIIEGFTKSAFDQIADEKIKNKIFKTLYTENTI